MSVIRVTPLRLLLATIGLLLTTYVAVSAADKGPLTFDKVLEYLDLEVKEEKLIKMVEDSPTQFTLGNDQVEFLKSKGASDALIDAMQKNAGPPGDAPQAMANTSDYSDFIFILDCSGSMKEKTADGQTKWNVAQKAALDLVSSVPDGKQLSFIVYGHDAARECDAVDTLKPLSPISAKSRGALLKRIQQLSPVGHTPIAKALAAAAEEMKESSGLTKLVLITDGMETCHGDPAQVAADLAENENLKEGVTVIGFGLNDNEADAVATIAKAGKGEFHDARKASDLIATVQDVQETIVKPKEKAASNSEKEQVKASTSKESPAKISIGKYTAARLAPGKTHYYEVDAPAGEYVVICDLKRADDQSSNIQCAMTANEAQIAGVNEIDTTTRMAGTLSHSEGSIIIAVSNNGSGTDIQDYKFGIYPSDKFPLPMIDVGYSFDTIEVGQKYDFKINPARLGTRDAYVRCNVPAGDFLLEFTTQMTKDFATSGATVNNGAKVEELDELGVTVKSIASIYETETMKPSKERVKLILAEDKEFFLRIRCELTHSEKGSLKITPFEKGDE